MKELGASHHVKQRKIAIPKSDSSVRCEARIQQSPLVLKPIVKVPTTKGFQGHLVNGRNYFREGAD
jgi:hypothetical protein